MKNAYTHCHARGRLCYTQETGDVSTCASCVASWNGIMYLPGPEPWLSRLETGRACWLHSPDRPHFVTTDSSLPAGVASCPGASMGLPQPRLRLNFGHYTVLSYQCLNPGC